MIFHKAVVATMIMLAAAASVDKVASTDAPTTGPTTVGPTSVTEGPTSDTEVPTSVTEEPTSATEEPTDVPTVAPTDSITLSPIAETGSGVTGLAAPGPAPTRERRLSADHLTVADFVPALDAAIESKLAPSSCIVESSAIRYDAANSVCTDAFTVLAGSFCYRFQTTISAPDETCAVNVAAELVTEAAEAGEFAGAIGGMADIVVQVATTNSPTDAPSSSPSNSPSDSPSSSPSNSPSDSPSSSPSNSPSDSPSSSPSNSPSDSPSSSPSNSPSGSPSSSPSSSPSDSPSRSPSSSPSDSPRPSSSPSCSHSDSPSSSPSNSPSDSPSSSPSSSPSDSKVPSSMPSLSIAPTISVSDEPSAGLSEVPSATSAAPSGVLALAPKICTNTKTGKFKLEGIKRKKDCKGWAKKNKCNRKIADEDGGGRVSSVCGKSCATNTKKGKFKLEDIKRKKDCKWWATKDKCNSNLKDGNGKVSSVCGKSCGQCAPSVPSVAPSAAPSAVPSLSPAPTPAICTNTKKRRKFKVEGVKKRKHCQWYATRDKCDSKIADEDGGGQVFSACAKSCRKC